MPRKPAKKSVKASIDKKIDDLSKKIDEYKNSAIKAEKDAELKIQEHPLQSIAYAFGAGVVAGAVVVAMMRKR